MQPIDESTYGFNKADAFELLQVIGNTDAEHPDGVGRMSPCLYGKTKTGGITVGTPAFVRIYDEDGVLSTRELLAETRVSDIPGDTEVILFSAYARWLALRIC